MSEEQNSPGWRYLRDEETVQAGDEFLSTDCMWCLTDRVGEIAGPNVTYRRRIEPQQADYPSDKERYQRLLESVFAEAAEYKAKWQSCIKLQADYRSGELTKQTTHEVQQLREKVETLSDMVQQLISRLTPTIRSREQE
jgi:hypothetical protein